MKFLEVFVLVLVIYTIGCRPTQREIRLIPPVASPDQGNEGGPNISEITLTKSKAIELGVGVTIEAEVLGIATKTDEETGHFYSAYRVVFQGKKIYIRDSDIVDIAPRY
ncbi:hypothetical protein [Stieleria mannarensis]|uniref:hypothetical protein n=1 Tax=Stieleria mannarensis TaxID=2755585 RepID=UPI0015FF304F|nr:hypothetical protein [Rhodopirellula sp. JC639]